MSNYTVFGYQQAGTITLNPNICVVTDANGSLLSSNISSESLSYLYGLTGNIQTQLSECPQISTPLTNNKVVISTGTNSIATSSISTTNLNSLDTTSSITTQLAAKQPLIILNNNIVPITNSSGALTSSTVSATNLSSLDTTSSITTQLAAKQPLITGLTSGDHLIATGSSSIGNSSVLSESSGTLNITGSVAVVNSSSTGFTVGYGGNTYFVVNTSTPSVYIGGSASAILYTSKISTTNPGSNVALVTDGSYNISGSTTTSTELGYVHGVTSAIQTQLNGKQALLSGLTSGDYIKATGSGSIGNASVLSESGSNLTAAGNFLPSNTNTNNLGNSNYTWGGVAANNIVAENGTVYNYCQSLTLGLINSNYGIYTTMTAGTANYYFCFASGSGWFTNASILPSSDGYSGLGAAGQRWNSLYTQQATITPASDGAALVVKAAGGSSVLTVNTSTNTVSAAGNLQVGANLTFASNSYNSGTALLCPATTYSGSFYAPTALNNAFVANNGTSNYFNVNGLTSTTQVANLALTGTNGGTILYNSSNSSAGAGYPTMDPVYTYEFILTATNINASTYPVGQFIPYPSGKSAANIRKLDAIMYDGVNAIPPNYATGTGYTYSVRANNSGIYVETPSTWTQTTGSKTFYIWITTN